MITPIARAARGCAALIGGALMVSACAPDGGVGGEVSQGAVSEGEARALDEAAEMLEQRQLPDGALPDRETGDAPPADAPPANVSQPDTPSPEARGTLGAASD